MNQDKMHLVNKIFKNETIRTVWDKEDEKYYISVVDFAFNNLWYNRKHLGGSSMFKTIEKNYKKNLRETKFNKFYWITSILLILSSSLLQISDNIKPYFIYILLLIFVIGYFIINYKKTMKYVNIKK